MAINSPLLEPIELMTIKSKTEGNIQFVVQSLQSDVFGKIHVFKF